MLDIPNKSSQNSLDLIGKQFRKRSLGKLNDEMTMAQKPPTTDDSISKNFNFSYSVSR